MLKTRTSARQARDPELSVAIADAQAAADAAARTAADAMRWTHHFDAGCDDAAEASRCAMRARLSAERAEHCTTAAEAWSCARLAWASVTTALEASTRVNAAIAETLAAA